MSRDGALLEFQGAAPRCLSFRLEIDTPKQEYACEVVHWQGGALGVRFDLFCIGNGDGR